MLFCNKFYNQSTLCKSHTHTHTVKVSNEILALKPCSWMKVRESNRDSWSSTRKRQSVDTNFRNFQSAFCGRGSCGRNLDETIRLKSNLIKAL